MNGEQFYKRWWRPLEEVLAEYENNGVLVDFTEAHTSREQLQLAITQNLEILNGWTIAPINWQSPQQVNAWLYEIKGYQVPPVQGPLVAVQTSKDYKTGEFKRSASQASLAWLLANKVQGDDAIALKALIEYKKLIRDYQFLEKLPKHANPSGRVHYQLGPNTETGRLSCKNPNMQQMPVSAKKVIVPRPGYILLCLDYSGLEWRILAHALAYKYDDTSLLDDITNGVDPHNATAKRMFNLSCDVADVKKLYTELRATGKTLNYSINYGKTGTGLGIQLTGESGEPIGTKKGWELIERFYAGNPGIQRFHSDCIEYSRTRGYARTLLGRYRYLEGVWPKRTWSPGDAMRPIERYALNTPIQGGAMDILVVAMVQLHRHKRFRELGCIPLLQNHDELLWEVPEEHATKAKEIASYVMSTSFAEERPFVCPLAVDGGLGMTWEDAKNG